MNITTIIWVRIYPFAQIIILWFDSVGVIEEPLPPYPIVVGSYSSSWNEQ